MLEVSNPRCEYLENPIGIGETQPRFSWMLTSDENCVMQASYRIQVSKEVEDFKNPIWDSGTVDSDTSVHVRYGGPELVSCTRYFYRIAVADSNGNRSPWSTTCFFETGILSSQEWQADFISPEDGSSAASSAAFLLKKDFKVDKKIQSARIYASSLGLYALRLNGKKVGDAYLTPGWTSYNKRLQYQTYDVTGLLSDSGNTIGAVLGCGWYKGNLVGWKDSRNLYGSRTALILELRIKYSDGSEQRVLSDESWKASPSPILFSEIYHGEIYDARLEIPDWDRYNSNAGSWYPAVRLTVDKGVLTAQENEPIRITDTLKPESIFKTPAGETVVDMGQNMVGWVRIKVKGPRGSKVVLKHAEVLDSEGNFYTENLRSARQTVEYILKSEAEECFEPHFTFQGFRYVKVEEFPGEPSLENFTGIVLHSGMKGTGEFSCSNELLNKLQHNILWGLKGNFVDVPTDCPQRDERLGWTGDAQVFTRTACYIMNTAPFFRKWLKDMKADQLENGGIPYVIPHVLKEGDHSSSGWGDAAAICPWTVYLCYGDVKVLEDQYECMKGWVEYIRAHSEDGLIWNTGFHYGDWLGLDAKEGSYVGATSKDLIATAFYAYSTELLAKAATLLNKTGDAEKYTELHKDIVKAFRDEFITPRGRISCPTQTAHVLALIFNLVDEKDKKRTVDTLVKYLEENKWHLTTGFLGTPYLCQVLSANGHIDAAYKLLLQTDYPSWLYPVTKGATTIWEHWDGIKPDGSFWSADMNSFNHYAYGAVGDWMYRVIGGIDTSEEKPGYKHSLIRPVPGGGLEYASAQLETMYGTLKSSWKLAGKKLHLDISIPHNTTAEVVLPGAQAGTLENIAQPLRQVAGGVSLTLGSGQYSFEYEQG